MNNNITFLWCIVVSLDTQPFISCSAFPYIFTKTSLKGSFYHLCMVSFFSKTKIKKVNNIHTSHPFCTHQCQGGVYKKCQALTKAIMRGHKGHRCTFLRFDAQNLQIYLLKGYFCLLFLLFDIYNLKKW